MQKIVVAIPADPKYTAYLEMLSYEVEGLKVLNCQIIKSGKPDTAHYRELFDRYLDRTKEYRVAFNEIVKASVPAEYLAGGYKYEVNFMTVEILIYGADAGGACDGSV